MLFVAKGSEILSGIIFAKCEPPLLYSSSKRAKRIIMHPSIRWITVAAVLLLPALPATATNPASITRGLSKVFNVDDVDVRPVPIKRTAPSYPPELRAAKVQGGVMVEFVTGLKGEVVGAKIISTDDTRLNNAAVEAVLSWQFKPAKYKGHEVFCRTTQLLAFSLN